MFKADMPFNALEWEITEDGLFAKNRRSGELILLSRFEDSYRGGIEHIHKYKNQYQNMLNTTDCNILDCHTLYEKVKELAH